MTDQRFFFSYAREDSEFVLKLARELRAVGANLWLDQLDIIGGQRWDHAVEQGLESCQGMIACLSPESLASNNVMDEVSYALDEGKLVVPILLRPCVIPFRLRRLQHVDFAGTDYDAAFSQLLKGLAVEPATPPVQRNARTAPTPPAPAAKSTRLSPALLIGVGAVLALSIVIGYVASRGAGDPPPGSSTSDEPRDTKPSSPAPPTPNPTVDRGTGPADPASNPSGRLGRVGPKVDQPATAAAGSLAPGIWSGTLTFAGAVSEISIEFCDDASLRLKSRLGDRAFGKWLSPSKNAVRIDARHRDFGLFTCELAATGSSLNGPCQAAGRPAGVIGLSAYAESPRTFPSVGIALNGTQCEQRSFAETPTNGEPEEQTRRRWEAFLQSIRN